MTETSQNKTKRKYVSLLTDYYWSYQCSVFYEHPSDSIHLLEDMKPFKQRLRRRLPDIPMLIRVCLLNRDGELQAYLSIHTVQNIREIVTEVATQTFSAPPSVVGRKRGVHTIASAAATIARQKPHNLLRMFGDRKINRYSLLNGQYLVRQSHNTN